MAHLLLEEITENADGLPAAELGRETDDGLQSWPTLPTDVVKSAGRAMQILEFFEVVRRRANAMEISRALAYPQSSTSILLRSLVRLGYLDYERGSRTYQPTGRVRLLGSWIDPQAFQGGALLGLMTELNRKTSHLVILATRNGLHTQYIHTVDEHGSRRRNLPPGSLRPIATSISGWILLSRLPDLEVAKLVRRINAEARPHEAPIKAAELLGRLEAIRRAGHAFCPSIIAPGETVLAAPLPASFGETPLVIAISGPTEDMEARRCEVTALLSTMIKDAQKA